MHRGYNPAGLAFGSFVGRLFVVYTVASVALEIFALNVTFMLIASTSETLDSHNRREIIFFWMLIVNFAALLCDLITWVFESIAATVLLLVVNSLVFALGYVMDALFSSYLRCYLKRFDHFDEAVFKGIYLCCGFAVVLSFVSIFNGMYFYVQDGTFYMGGYAWLSLLLSLIPLVLNLCIVLRRKTDLGSKLTSSFVFYCAVPIVAILVQLTGIELTITWLCSTLTMLEIYAFVHIAYALELQKQSKELTEARLRLQLSQINPHFLFNVLNSIYELCEEDPKKAHKAIGEFSDYFRQNLSLLGQSKLITFDMELAHLRNYLSLEQMRYGDRLQVTYDLQTSSFFLPAITVQPLVENSIKHGLSASTDRLNIKVSSREFDTYYQVVVEDDGVGFDVDAYMATQRPNQSIELAATSTSRATSWEGGAHVGLAIVRHRLEVTCNGYLSIQSEPGKGTKAIIVVPKEFGGRSNKDGNTRS